MFSHLTYVLLDAARMGTQIEIAQVRNKAYETLYRGTSSEKLAAVAPYLFQFAYSTPFANWYLRNGWGESWGVMLKSGWPLQELQKHFRKFLKVETEAGQSLYFRFYDPRVLRIFLPTCDTAQLREFFGPIDYFIMEDEDPAVGIRYWQENGFLKTDRQPVAALIAGLQEPAPLPAAAQEQLPPETLAIIEELRKQYPDVAFPGDAREPEAQKAPIVKEHEQQAPAKPAQKPGAGFWTLDTEGAQPGESDAAPTPKTKWNMFD